MDVWEVLIWIVLLTPPVGFAAWWSYANLLHHQQPQEADAGKAATAPEAKK